MTPTLALQERRANEHLKHSLIILAIIVVLTFLLIVGGLVALGVVLSHGRI